MRPGPAGRFTCWSARSLFSVQRSLAATTSLSAAGDGEQQQWQFLQRRRDWIGKLSLGRELRRWTGSGPTWAFGPAEVVAAFDARSRPVKFGDEPSGGDCSVAFLDPVLEEIHR